MSFESRLYSFTATDTSAWYGNRSKAEVVLSPTSKMACPCDTCPLAFKPACANGVVVCKAFEDWSSTGKYVAKFVGRKFIAA